MWQCPKCRREFKSTNQDHFCTPITSIDAYIQEQNAEVIPVLEQIRATIAQAAPDATEKISWRMPTFWQHENLIHFAAFKHHFGLFPGSLESSPFAKQLKNYETSKGTIRFYYDKPIDFELISDITKWRVQTVEARMAGATKASKNTKGTKTTKTTVAAKTSAEPNLNCKLYEFDATIQKVPDQDGAYVVFPYDIKQEFGRGRVKVHATFDGVAYDGSIVNMGIKNLDGSICYIIGITKGIRATINKQPGNSVTVTIRIK